MKLVVVGASRSNVCGVRDCARVLDPALRSLGHDIETVWWDVGGETFDDWRSRIDAAKGDVVLWHYVPTSYGPRGLPTLAPRVASAVHTPLVLFLHELAHRLLSGGARGFVQGVVQRATLARLLRASDGALVTTVERAELLRASHLYASRPVRFTPVPSNIRPSGAPTARNGHLRVGVFGFRSGSGVLVDEVAAAVGRLAPDATLTLIGAPGAASPEAEAWRRAAASAGVDLDFTGVLDEDALSRALRSTDVIVAADWAGPTPRKGTLAAALAHGRPVVATAGPYTWQELVSAEALVLASRDSAAIAAGIAQAGDPARAEEQGRRARRFYDERMSPEAVARTVSDFLHEVAGR